MDAYLPLLFADPQLVERSKTCKNTASEPTTIAPLGWVAWSMNFDLGEIDDQTVISKDFCEAYVIDVSLELRIETVGKARE